MIVILNKIEVITTYGKLLYEAINKEIVMKKIENRYTNNIFENIKHIDEQLVEVNKEIIMPLLIYKIINFQDIYVI